MQVEIYLHMDAGSRAMSANDAPTSISITDAPGSLRANRAALLSPSHDLDVLANVPRVVQVGEIAKQSLAQLYQPTLMRGVHVVSCCLHTSVSLTISQCIRYTSVDLTPVACLQLPAYIRTTSYIKHIVTHTTFTARFFAEPSSSLSFTRTL